MSEEKLCPRNTATDKLSRLFLTGPGKVTSLAAENSTGTSILVGWDVSMENPLKGELVSFKVSWRGTGIHTSEREKIIQKRRYRIMDLRPNTTYIIKVSVYYLIVFNYVVHRRGIALILTHLYLL